MKLLKIHRKVILGFFVFVLGSISQVCGGAFSTCEEALKDVAKRPYGVGSVVYALSNLSFLTEMEIVQRESDFGILWTWQEIDKNGSLKPVRFAGFDDNHILVNFKGKVKSFPDIQICQKCETRLISNKPEKFLLTVEAPILQEKNTDNFESSARYSHPIFWNRHFYAKARLDSNGTLSLNFSLEDTDGVRIENFLGKDQFDQILDHFAGRVNRIRSHWKIGKNFDTYIKLIDAGLKVEDAAKGTWTGIQALRHGFTEVRPVPENERVSPNGFEFYFEKSNLHHVNTLQ